MAQSILPTYDIGIKLNKTNSNSLMLHDIAIALILSTNLFPVENWPPTFYWSQPLSLDLESKLEPITI